MAKESWDRGVTKDSLLLTANAASFFDPTGLSGIALGVAQLHDIATTTPIEGGVGALSLSAGVVNFGNNVRGIQVTGRLAIRGSSITMGSTFWRGVPGLNKAFAAVSVALSGAALAGKMYEIHQFCQQNAP